MKIIQKDITEVTKGIIAHGVNCLGVMGAGVALAIRNKWPIVFERYSNLCTKFDTAKHLLGYTQTVNVGDNLFVANCFTQEECGFKDGKPPADIDAVKDSVGTLFYLAHEVDLPIASVKIASDLGGLDWETEVKPIYEELEKQYPDVELTIYYI